MAEDVAQSDSPVASTGDPDQRAESPPAARRGRRKPVLLIGLGVLVVLVGFGAFFGWQAVQGNSEQARRDEVLQTARQAADNLTTIDYHTADRDVQQLVEGSTPEFARQFGIASPDFLEVVKGSQLVATGDVTSAAIQRLDEHSARVLVAVDGSVRDVNTPQGTPRRYRLGMELVEQDGDWLVSKVDFLS